jgi:hypothetical protein
MTLTVLSAPLSGFTPGVLPLQWGGTLDFSQIAVWSLILLGCLAAVTLGLRFFRSGGGKIERGEEFTVMGLKGLHRRGVITDEEYSAVKKKMAERIAKQMQEEERRRAEVGKPSLPAEIGLAHEAEALLASKSRPRGDSPRDLGPATAPEPGGGHVELTDEEITRLQREELERKRRIAERSQSGPSESG